MVHLFIVIQPCVFLNASCSPFMLHTRKLLCCPGKLTTKVQEIQSVTGTTTTQFTFKYIFLRKQFQKLDLTSSYLLLQPLSLLFLFSSMLPPASPHPHPQLTGVSDLSPTFLSCQGWEGLFYTFSYPPFCYKWNILPLLLHTKAWGGFYCDEATGSAIYLSTFLTTDQLYILQ